MPASKRAGAAALVAVGVLSTYTVVTDTASSQSAGHENNRIKNVIYLLGDGMGRTTVTAARDRYYGASGHLVMETMPSVGQVSTYAVQKQSGQPGEADFEPEYVTDSASSATAWASGVKTYNAALGIDAKGAIVPTLMGSRSGRAFEPATCPPRRSPTRRPHRR